MGVVLVLGALGLVALPGALRPLGRRLDPRDWTLLCTMALTAGLGTFEMGLVLYAAPTVLPAVGAFGLASLCARMLGDIAPGGAAAGWAAAALASVVVGCAALGALRARRTRRGIRVEPWLGEHKDLGRHDLVVLARDDLVAVSVGHKGGQVIVSSGLVRALSDQELHVVLAHERAHLDHRHQRYLHLASAVRWGLGWFPPARWSVSALVVALERWADEVAASSIDDGRTQLRSALHHVTTQLAGVAIAAFSGADTVAERLAALDRPVAGLRLSALGLLYSPGFVLGVTSLAGLGIWVRNLEMMIEMAGRCPL